MGRKHTFELVTRDAEDHAVKSTYEVRLMTAWDQHQVLRRIAPLVAARVGGTMGDSAKVNTTRAVVAMISALTDLSEEDHDYVVDKLLGCVQRTPTGVSPPQWGAIWNKSTHTFFFDDLNYDLDQMYAIAQEVVEFTYGNFMQRVMSHLPRRAMETTSTSPP